MHKTTFAALLLCCGPALGQTPSATLLPETQPVIQTERGKVHTCGVNFSTFVSDNANRNGRYVLLVGSINMMYAKGKMPAATLKLQAADVLEMKDGQLQQTPFNPGYAYFKVRDETSANKEISSFVCEGGGWCSAFTDNAVIDAAIHAIYGGAFSVAYTRPRGTIDVVAAIPGKEFTETQQCLLKLSERFKAQD